MKLFQCIVCVIKVSRVQTRATLSFFMYCKVHAQCNIAARWMRLNAHKSRRQPNINFRTNFFRT